MIGIWQAGNGAQFKNTAMINDQRLPAFCKVVYKSGI
jgi:hypothetical protein